MPRENEIAGCLHCCFSPSRDAALASTRTETSSPLRTEPKPLDRGLIQEGQTLLRRCIAEDRPGPYQIQAAIQAVHADAAAVNETDWPQILGLYDHLLRLVPGPVVALNRAVALAEVQGPDAALALIDEIEIEGYAPLHADTRRLPQATRAS